MKNRKIFKIIDLDEVNENECVKKANYVGFGHFYLRRYKESKPEDDIDKEIYSKIVELDTRLGTSPSEQLFMCIFTLDLEIIKVFFSIKDLSNLNYFSLTIWNKLILVMSAMMDSPFIGNVSRNISGVVSY